MESIASAISGAMTGLAGLAEKNNFYFSADKADYPQSVDEVRRELEKAKTLSPDKAARIAQKFFTYYALLDWKDKNGNPVKDWQKLLRWWADNERQEPARTNAGEYVSENAEAYRSFVYHMDE